MILKEKTEMLRENLSQCHFLYHKSHKGLPEIYSGLPVAEAGN